jgi:Fe2+ transport system protein FeoA
MRLIDIGDDRWVRVVGFEGKRVQLKMLQYGLYPGDMARIIRRAPLGGPILIEAGGREVALGLKLAEKIQVESV